jgi:hypothetical protein
MIGKLIDPLKFGKVLWPKVDFYKEQKEIIYSVLNNDITVVPAGNMLGKDFVSAFIVLWFFLTRQPCRILTTSADFAQLRAVLWGEMRRFIQDSKYPLEADQGGPLIVNDLHIRRAIPLVNDRGAATGYRIDPLSYIIGRVTAKGEGALGHHIADIGDGIPRTLFLADEASGVEDIAFERADTWARRILMIGNCFPCTNRFYKYVKAGDIPARDLPHAPGQPTMR